MTRRPLLLALILVAGCRDSAGDGPIAVSVIGGAPTRTHPDRGPLAPADAVLLGATAQGLVRFDAAGQIEPGLAIRWDVSDDGLYYTFRIADGQRVRAAQAAVNLRASIAPASRNPLKFVLGAVDEIVAVTPQVIEVRLHAPRPNLLQLFAQPELAMMLRGRGAGPLVEEGRAGGALQLAPMPEPGALPDDPPRPAATLRAEPAAHAVVRFRDRERDLVLGGTYADLALAQAIRPGPRSLRFDPAKGLFGIAFVRNHGFAGSAEGRRALAMAIDRERLVRSFGVPGWAPAITLVPAGTPDLGSPARPDWSDTPLERRRAVARASVAAWAGREGAAPTLSIDLPPGPGSRLLLALLQRDWRAIGVRLVLAPRGDGDLRLIDSVAPADIASWYLRSFTCDLSAVCSEAADALLIAAREAPTLLERGLKLAAADARFAEITPFIPLAAPLRWSLVAPRLTGFQENARAVHPLDHLVAARR